MMKPKSKPKFEDALAEVERMVGALESGEAPLEEAIGSYEKGIRAIQDCYGILEKAEARLLLLQKDAEGRLKVQKVQVEKGGLKPSGRPEPIIREDGEDAG